MLLVSLLYLSLTAIAHGRAITQEKRACVGANCARQLSTTVPTNIGVELALECDQSTFDLDGNEATDPPINTTIFSEQTSHVLVSLDADGPSKRSLFPRQEAERPDAEEPEASGPGRTGTLRFRDTDYENLCWASDRVYLVDNTNPDDGRMGDTILALPLPNVAPDYQNQAGRTAKVWACDHILELNFIDDFLNQDPTLNADILAQLTDSEPEKCQLTRMKRILNANSNLFGVDRRVNKLKNVLLQGSTPNWANWEDYAVAGTYLYLQDPQVRAKYFDRTDFVARALRDFAPSTDARNIYTLFTAFSTARYTAAVDAAAAQWLLRGNDSIDGNFRRIDYATAVVAQRADPDFRPRGLRNVQDSDDESGGEADTDTDSDSDMEAAEDLGRG